MFKRLKRLFRKSRPIIHVVRLEGAIMSGRGPAASLNDKALEPILAKAFRKGVAAVALAINCPGGSPVQSALIGARIRQLAAEKQIPVLAFCEDVAASGGYWLACAADEIYADENSIIGSIGVISGSFGFPKALAKLGVERRVYTAGDSKSTNDPFKPENPREVARLKGLLGEIHDSFKAMVRERRAGKLKADEKTLFDGSFWTGRKALELGLVDGLGHRNEILKQRFGENAEIDEMSPAKPFAARLFGLGSRHALATELTDSFLTAIEQRALWQRFGL
ncbi:MAG: S49 family peptidase [Alphaproteobacteria bacterium]|nr:S49 family peptidase [Alphaproteobacteria bacterium]